MKSFILYYETYFHRFPSILPILETDFAVKKIVEAIQTNQPALYTPRVLYLLIALKG